LGKVLEMRLGRLFSGKPLIIATEDSPAPRLGVFRYQTGKLLP
jgi:hypothetical protein